jgi:hypothetical protein
VPPPCPFGRWPLGKLRAEGPWGTLIHVRRSPGHRFAAAVALACTQGAGTGGGGGGVARAGSTAGELRRRAYAGNRVGANTRVAIVGGDGRHGDGLRTARAGDGVGVEYRIGDISSTPNDSHG